MTEVLEGEAVEETTLAIRNEYDLAHSTLFGTADPQAVVERATKVANALMGVVKKKGLAKRIGPKEYLLAEAWTMVGSMLGAFPRTAWTRKLENGWEARVEVVTRSGEIIGAAEAECLNDERNWKSRDDYALRSMAQTRAMGKALRMPLGFIAVLAGFEATPAEEMGEEGRGGGNSSGPPRASSPSAPTEAQWKKLAALRNKLTQAELLTDEQYHNALARDFNLASESALNQEQAEQVIGRLERLEKNAAK